MKMHRMAAAAGAAAFLTALAAPALADTAPDRLFIAQNGVALSQFPSRSRLTTEVTVGVTNADTSARWKASSDAAWLTVTAGGRTGKPLTLTADPTALAADKLYKATVSVSTKKGSTFQDTETIRVSFWKGSADPGIVAVTHDAASIAGNPVEPIAYVSDGTSDVAVFDVYSGELLRTFAKVAPNVGKLAVSSDGTKLFAVDTTNYRIVEVDARTGKRLNRFQLQGPIAADFNFAYARPAGNETLFAAGQVAIDVASGQAVSPPITAGSGFYDPYLVASPDGSRLAVIERGQSPGALYTWSVAPADGQLAVTAGLDDVWIEGENCQSMAMSPDGGRLYPACGWPYEFDVFDWSSGQQVQTLPADAYPNSAAFDSNGDFVGGIDGVYDDYDVFVFNRKGYSLGKVATTDDTRYGGQGNDLLATSGDSTRVITATGDFADTQKLVFRSMP